MLLRSVRPPSRPQGIRSARTSWRQAPRPVCHGSTLPADERGKGRRQRGAAEPVTEATFLFLSQEDVVAAGGLEIAPTIEVVAEALLLHASGQTVLPHKPTIRWNQDLD